eukprot:CAMPEP_0114540946 /NCGR_PEP_ID=MMETSP0114-20121206/1043_1 /TAXON_ID=31324 /ORGANISM="Goniomonas sp, Strain m" /LENGTH=290 /DNA_ID=CAMNT_0001725151 /DNA_START=13 /DNA_END=885 /DNA_ORIENTATION=-
MSWPTLLGLLVATSLVSALPSTEFSRIEGNIGQSGTWFERVLIIMFENHSEAEVIANKHFRKYTNLGRGLENYYAITHPSQPNYISMTCGDYFGHNTDDNVDLDVSNIADLLEAGGLTWKAYMESYPGGCNSEKSVGKYFRKHNPFMSYNNIRNNATRCANIVDDKQLDKDLESETLPQYMYLSPNIDDDGHDTSVSYAGKWLDNFFATRLLKFPTGTLVVVTWDEDDHSEKNKVLTFLLDPNGSIFPAGTVDDTLYDHYSLLRTIEDNWNLGTLGRNDANAIPFNFTKA